MAYEFNKNIHKMDGPSPDFSDVQKKIKALILQSSHYFPQNVNLESNLKSSYIDAERLNKEVTAENIKKLELNWENSIKSLKEAGVGLREVSPAEGMTPENDLIMKLNDANSSVKSNINKSKLSLGKDDVFNYENEIARVISSVENGVEPKIVLEEMSINLQKSNNMKEMPTIGKPGFNPHDRISATLKNKDNQRAFELTSDIVFQKNTDISKKCSSGYYSAALINGDKGNILHLAALNNPAALETLVYQGGADINQIKPDWVVNPETKKEIERMQDEKNHPIKTAVGIRSK